MTDSVGRALLTLIQREFVHSLHDAVAALAGTLDALAPDPAFEGTPFAGRVLAALTPDDSVLGALAGLVSDAAGPGQAGLHGWRPAAADGSPRGVAYVVRWGDGGVLAAAVVPSQGVQLELHAAGLSGPALTLSLANGFELRISGTTAGELDVSLPPDASPTLLTGAPGDAVEAEFVRTGDGDLIGVTGGPSVVFGAMSAGGRLDVTGGGLSRRGHLTLAGGQVVLAPGFLDGILPFDLSFPLDAAFTAAPDTGVVLAGSPSLRVRLSGKGGWLDVALDIADVADAPAGPALRVSATTRIDGTLPGAPVSVAVDGIGLSLPIPLGRGRAMRPDPAGLVPLLPSGAGVSLDLPVVQGSGALAVSGDDLVGALSVRIPPMSAAAFGLLSPAHDGVPLSFLVIVGATFPPPGIQIGFGFAVSGLGGVVGVNRRIDRDALIRAVTDGTAAQLLFPSDPEAAGPAAVQALPAVFPTARGSVVAGPMFQLSWGGRLVTLSAAVLVEASSQVKLTILGKLVVALPDPAVPLVFLQATFAGLIAPAEPSAMFVASLTGSHIVGAALSGDMLMLVRGGPDATLVISAGGFHPSFVPPRGVPALRRMSLDLCPVPFIEMRCEGYFALTSNTVQLGARLDLLAEVAGCGLRGFLAFDALVQFSPFHFVADISGGIALRAFGHTLCGVSLALHLEGPAPYLARGRGSIDLFLFEVSFDFEVGWGDPPPSLPPPPDVGAELRAVLTEAASWRSRGSAPAGLVLTGSAAQNLADSTVVDPYGSVSVRQERVPLAVQISRFQGAPVPAQQWDITSGEFGPGEPAERTGELRADFAPGQFVPSRSDDEALGAPAFLPLRAGIELVPAVAAGAESRATGLSWEERVIAHDLPRPERSTAGALISVEAVEYLLSAGTATDPGWWMPPEQVVSIDPVVPVGSAFAWSMTAGPVSPTVTALEMEQAIGTLPDLVAVEAWEL